VFTYWGWLIKEIVISAWQVTKIILSPTMNISPTIIEVQAKSSGVVRQVLFANSITLTPGTLTTDIDKNGLITVHALTREGAEGVLTGDMNDRVASLPASGGKS